MGIICLTGLLAFLSLIISSRLTWVFYNLKKYAINKQVIPLANVMFAKSLLFTIISGVFFLELAMYNDLPQQVGGVHTHLLFGTFFILCLFLGQLFLFYLTEIKNGWH